MNENKPVNSTCCPPPKMQEEMKPCCCGSPETSREIKSSANVHWVEGSVHTAIGDISRISTCLKVKDKFGAWKARWAIGRMRYRVEPGLYAVGNPTPKSPVLVSANYKLSFDKLRVELTGLDAWIIVLDTRGINIWCAAGKGTFGTDELINRLQTVKLERIISHRTLILPQLGAPGVSAHQVKQRSGFKVVYGPVRASDIKVFLENGMKASPEMRRVHFRLKERINLIPVELINTMKYALLIALGLVLLSGLYSKGFSFDRVISVGLWSGVLFLGGCLWTVAMTPTLLPWLPGRSFSVKGTWLGLVFALILGMLTYAQPSLFENRLVLVAWILIIIAVSSFIAMNFTGASTYTSLSGVKREMRLALPLQIITVATGFGLWLSQRFV